MPVLLAVGRRVFAPSWLATLLTALAIVAFVSLGRWQWERGNARAAQWREFEQGTDQVLDLGSRDLNRIERFARVRATGEYDARHQFLLDNSVREGRAGYEVLTPFLLTDGRLVLVDRGWLPSSGYRDRLPDVSIGGATSTDIIGRVDELPTAGLAEGRAAPSRDATWPKVTSFPTHDQLSAALGKSLQSRILLLDPRGANGYLREWQPPGLPPARHWGYAVQWWAFALAALVIWALMSMRKEQAPQ